MEKEQDRRSSGDRRHEQDPEYLGPERRTGIDARGEKPIPEEQKITQSEPEDEMDQGLDWLFDSEELPKSPKS